MLTTGGKMMDDNNKTNQEKGEYDGKTKGMRLSPSTRDLYETMKKAAGGTDDTFIEHLLHITKLHDLQKTDPEFAEELKELQKYLSRFSSVYIRMRERGVDALEETKERSLEAIGRLEQDLMNIQLELAELQKLLAQKDEQLAVSLQSNSDLISKMEQLEKTTKTVEELNRLTNEKLEQKEKRINELLHAEKDVADMKEQLKTAKEEHKRERAEFKEAERELKNQLEQSQRENDRQQLENKESILQIKKEFERATEVLIKEKDMEVKEAEFRVKSEWQEKLSELKNELSEKHANRIAELLEKFQTNKDEKM
ncbi:histone-lysine N-methyltransferase, H3 lysine-79 (plasmid) [Paenibacillus polymyxa M1]|nr:histone-lysine N-methyltransferase, H3 lysine-79 [Paenibacillus polymyxa M1]